MQPYVLGTERSRRPRVWLWLGPVLLVLGLCVVIPGAGITVWYYTHRCVLTPKEEGLVAAYSADPMIRAAKAMPAAGPIQLDGPCDYETGRLDGHVVVSVVHPADIWRTSDQLADMYRAATAAAGWIPATPDPDVHDEHPVVHYCRTINGLHALLGITLFRADSPQILEQTYISSEPRYVTGPGCS